MLNDFSIDETPHNRDGLVITARDGEFRVDAFISSQVMDEWVDPVIPADRRRRLYRSQYNDLGRRNLPAIARIVSAKYERGKTFNQHAYVEVLPDDIVDSGEVIDRSGLVRHSQPPTFHLIVR